VFQPLLIERPGNAFRQSSESLSGNPVHSKSPTQHVTHTGRAFTTTLFRHPGKGGWTFAPVPKRVAPPVTHPWGRTPVRANVDGREWVTSVWRDRKNDRSLLAVPMRMRAGKGHGDRVKVRIVVLVDEDDE
jgi:hypothetical protein